MKLTDIIVSAIIKKGLLLEARSVDTEFTIPMLSVSEPGETTPLINDIRIQFKCEHMTLRIEKEEKGA